MQKMMMFLQLCLLWTFLVTQNGIVAETNYVDNYEDDADDEVHYEPTWKSLDSRPLPSWYDEAKIGIFVHWGVFSVPSFNSEWFWNQWNSGNKAVVNFMKRNYKPGFTYADFANQFTAEFYDPNEWVDLFESAGAKYVVLTAKHHEGYTLWPSTTSFGWNSVDVGPKRDLVGALADAVRKRTSLHFGVYHSLFEWFNPMYLQDKGNNFTTRRFPKEKSIPELHELVEKYRPDVVWSDGDGFVSDDYWGSKEFLAWLYNDSPVRNTVVTNDRWGNGDSCHHGGFFSCHDKYNPGVLQSHKWENCMTLDRGSWGYRRNAKLRDYLSIQELLTIMAETVSCGGNLLVNVGPSKDGRIMPIFEERLRQMGYWLKNNGEAIYGSTPWKYQNDTVTHGVWYTSKKGAVYAIVLQWPTNTTFILGAPEMTDETVVTMLGYVKPLKAEPLPGEKQGMIIHFPPMSQVIGRYVYVLKITNV